VLLYVFIIALISGFVNLRGGSLFREQP
jgi:hypothetical protein